MSNKNPKTTKKNWSRKAGTLQSLLTNYKARPRFQILQLTARKSQHPWARARKSQPAGTSMMLGPSLCSWVTRAATREALMELQMFRERIRPRLTRLVSLIVILRLIRRCRQCLWNNRTSKFNRRSLRLLIHKDERWPQIISAKDHKGSIGMNKRQGIDKSKNWGVSSWARMEKGGLHICSKSSISLMAMRNSQTQDTTTIWNAPER